MAAQRRRSTAASRQGARSTAGSAPPRTADGRCAESRDASSRVRVRVRLRLRVEVRVGVRVRFRVRVRVRVRVTVRVRVRVRVRVSEARLVKPRADHAGGGAAQCGGDVERGEGAALQGQG